MSEPENYRGTDEQHDAEMRRWCTVPDWARPRAEREDPDAQPPPLPEDPTLRGILAKVQVRHQRRFCETQEEYEQRHDDADWQMEHDRRDGR